MISIMKFTHIPSIGEAYPSLFEGLPLLTPQDIQEAQDFLRDDAPEIAHTFKKNVIRIKLGDRAARAVFSQGEDNHTIIIPAEYGTGRGKIDDRDAVMRAYAMRAMINPDASLLYVPNNVFGENNLKLSPEEISTLRGTDTDPANFGPLTDRIMRALEQQGVIGDRLTGVGNSQGAAVITSLAARNDIDMHSISTFLPPDIIKRDKNELIKAFLSGGKNLFTNIEISKLDTESRFLSQNALDLLQFVVNAVGKGNRATMGPIMAGKHEEQVRQALQSTPHLVVVRGWTPNAAISPADANATAGERLRNEFSERVENYKITGDVADETSPNVFPISASLAKRAFLLANANLDTE
jgi:predicted esterase